MIQDMSCIKKVNEKLVASGTVFLDYLCGLVKTFAPFPFRVVYNFDYFLGELFI